MNEIDYEIEKHFRFESILHKKQMNKKSDF